MRNILWFCGVLFIGAAIFLAWFVPGAWFMHPANGAPTFSISIPAGSDASAVATRLADKGIIVSAAGYDFYSLLDSAARHPRAGDYQMTSGMSYRAAARMLALGPEREEVEVKLIEGWNLNEIGAALEKFGVSSTEFLALTADASRDLQANPEWRDEFPFLASLPAHTSLEGYLYPNTYRVWKDQLPQGLIEKQLAEFQKTTTGMADQAAEQKRSFRDVLILASIVEKEATTPEDRKIVAGIYLNRLKLGMPLQSDATINYVTGAGRARPVLKDLEVSSPYNTYKHAGLPPGPICNPGAISLDAALHPTQTDYLYYLHDDQGKSYYAKTLQEHIRNRAKAYGE